MHNKFLHALTFFALLFFSISELRAQIAYQFTTTPDSITISTTPNVTALTIDCLSANGYGQWTSSSTSTGDANLLSNKLTSTVSDDAQNGLLATEPFAYSTGDGYPSSDAVKSAANLNGSVRYVWFGTANRNRFYAEGFDAASSIDISFSAAPTSATIVQSAPILGAHNPYPLTTGHMLVSSGILPGDEQNALDRFDIAIDASFLYVVWEENISGVYSVWAEVIKLSDGSVALGPTTVVTGGRRPTVAVDVRYSGSTPAPFDVAYLDPSIPSITGNVWWTQYISGTSFTAPAAISKIYTGTSAWISPTHARIMDASEATVTPSITNQRAVYVIAGTSCFAGGPSCHTHLFLDYIKNISVISPCEYCDGFLNNSRATSPLSAVEQGGLTTFFFEVDDNPIRAFANPYEGVNSALPATADFTEFHCLYQIDRTGYGITNSNNPLMIIPGSHVTSGYCLNGLATVGNFRADPGTNAIGFTNYCGAVNQMGVQVHWLSTTKQYYSRDHRAIAQNIEENTLLTSDCEVSANATLTNNWLTLFSDPQGTTGYLGTGVLSIDDGITLDINPTTDGGGDFVDIGASTIAFVGSPTSQAILEVDALDQMDFYGNTHSSITGGGEFKFVGSGDYMVGNSYGTWPDHITNAAILNIHGGTVLNVGRTDAGTNYFTCFDAKIHMNWETSVIPGITTNHGELLLDNHSSFTKCMIYSDDLSETDNPTVIQIGANGTGSPYFTGNGNYNSTYATAGFGVDTFEQCDFFGGEGDAPATMGIGDPSVAPNSLIIDNGWISGWEINGGNFLYWPISITNVTFYEVIKFGMDISFANTPPGADNKLYSLLVDGCDFEGYGDLTHFSNPDGVKVETAPDAALDDGLRESITVTDNSFESTYYGEDPGSIEAAIHFSDATGDIGYNHIDGEKYQRGIWNESSHSTATTQTTWTFICDNTISGMINTGAAGLSTDNYIGYAKLNSISDCTTGQVSAMADAGHIDFSTYTGNVGPGYAGLDGSLTDITGVHHPLGAGDVGAFDTIKSNNSGGAQITLDQTVLTTKVFLGLSQASGVTPSWSFYGENDIEGSPDVSSTATVNIWDISNNWWGGVSFSEMNVTSSDIPGDLILAPSTTGISCSSGLDLSKRGRVLPQSFLTLPDTTCGDLFSIGIDLAQQPQTAEQSYDTLRMFLEECPLYSVNGSESWEGFTYIQAAVSGWSAGGSGRWPDFLSFLKQVLYLNPDTQWYCEDVLTMMSALQYDEAAKEAAIQYVVESGKCPALLFAPYYNGASQGRHQLWLDSIIGIYDTVQPYGIYQSWLDSMVNKDTLANPYDSTIPSLQQENLQILLGPQNASVGASSPVGSQSLLSAQLLENPMNNEIDVSYQMGRTALVTMELRDVLGRSVPIANAKYQLEQPGDHNATIPAPNLPAGIYYLRITTDVGDAITLKIVKE